MNEKASSSEDRWPHWLFYLTAQERKLVLGILVLFLLGLVARHVHLKSQSPDPAPVPIESHRTGFIE